MAGRKKPPLDESPFGRAAAFIERSTDTLITLQTELVKRNAVSPSLGGPGEGAKADYMGQWFASHGFPQVLRFGVVQDGIERPNLVVRIPGKDRSRTLWFVSHLDVSPPGDRGMWKSDPFSMRVEGDKLVGCGVEDNHQGIVCSVVAAMALLQQGLTPACDTGILLVADGEAGGEWGVKYLLERHGELFGQGDAFVVTDAGNEDGSLIVVAEKTVLLLRIRVVGKQAHASTPHLGKNALFAASSMVIKLRSLYDRFDSRDPAFDPPMSTFEATRIEVPSDNVAVVPGEAIFYLDCRLLQHAQVENVLSHIRQVAEEIGRVHRVVVQIEVLRREDGTATSTDAPIVAEMTRAIRRVYGVEARLRGFSKETLARHIRKAGFPAVAWSRVDDTARKPNEYVWIQNLIGDSKVFAALMLGENTGGPDGP